MTGNISKRFSVNNLRQDWGRSTWLFKVDMGGVVREFYKSTQGKRVSMFDWDLREWLLIQLLFVDDTALVAESVKQLHCLVKELRKMCKKRKWRVNLAKNGYGGGEGKDFTPGKSLDEREIMEVVSSFKQFEKSFQ